jgi:hypothetical protein
MPLPILFIGVAVATGGVGAGKTIKAGIDSSQASKINKSANQIVEESTEYLNAHRKVCGDIIRQLGEEKVNILNGNIKEFLDTFSQLKNVDFRESEGLSELSKLHIDEKEFVELKNMCNFAISLAGGSVVGTAGGAIAAFGAYGAAQALACASTGTAISALSGAAATNATLAFFGGGSLATGGLGMAGGTMVLGGLVAGPALLVMGLVAGEAAKKSLEQAKTNRLEAVQLAEQLDTASKQCEAIRRRTGMLYNLLARLDTYFLPYIYKMEDIVKADGYDYSTYSTESKKCIAACASIAVSIKAVLDTQLLTDDGLLTDKSNDIVVNTEQFINQVVRLM